MDNIPPLELKILNVMWVIDRPASVQEIIDSWNEETEPGYTTVLKKLQVMEKKGTVSHEKSGKMYLYFPAVEQSSVRKSRLSSLLSEVFQNDPVRLFSTLVSESDLNDEDLKEIRRIIEENSNE